MTYLGAHLSSSRGFYKMGLGALAMDANTFQCFVRNPRGARAKAADPADLAKLRELMAGHGFGPIVAHAPYIMNPCSKDEGIRELAARMMAEDLELVDQLPGSYYNFHPGSHVGQGVETGCRQIAAMLDRVVTPERRTTVLLETMAGKGSEIGGRFDELRRILDLAACGDRLGVCLDTCHVSDGGYDIVNGLDGVLEEFDRVEVNDFYAYRGPARFRLALSPGSFLVVFPNDAHRIKMQLDAPRTVTKVVFKVRIIDD